MSELNGTKAILMLGSGGVFASIVGQADLTSTSTGVPIDISSKSSGDFVSLMNAENSGKGESVAVTLLYSNDSSYREIKRLARQHEIADFKVSFNETDESDIFLSGIVQGLSDAIPLGDKITTSFTLLSTGDVFRSQYFSASGTDRFNTSDGYELRVRYE
jgi:hypothetical protein